MGRRQPVLHFPTWTHTVGGMLDAGMAVQMMCTEKCSRVRAPDLAAIIAAKGRDYSLVNKRFPCRWKPNCPGWIRTYYISGVMRPLWSDPTAIAWIEQDHAEGERRRGLRKDGLKRLGTFRDRFDVGVVDPDSMLTTEDLDVILGRRIRKPSLPNDGEP